MYVLTHKANVYQMNKIHLNFYGGFLILHYSVPTGLPQQNFSMHVAVPVTNPNSMSYNPGGILSSQGLQAAATASLSEATMLSPPQTSLQRNVVPAGAPHRPPSTGSAGQ
ncbi:myocyte enhancer factor 2aa isoform X3 [Tachysurus ichikawai]